MCTAAGGGAIYVKQSLLIIEESKFIGNEAFSTGGAVDVYTSKDQYSEIRNSVFYRNKANEGGAVKWNDAEVSFLNCTFQDNTAFYGPDVASYGVQISGGLASSNGTEASGYPLQLIFELQDHYGQRVTTASKQDFQLMSSTQIHFRGNTAITVDHGIFNFSKLIVYARPNSEQQILGTMFAAQKEEIVMLSASVNITFRDCEPGEVRKPDRCEYCFAGNVSFTPSDNNCNFCPKHAFCPGGNVLFVESGYWRSSLDSIDLIPCPLRSNCLGGELSDCAAGYTGQVCNECSEDYTRHRTLECGPCNHRILQWTKAALVVVPIVGFYVAVRIATDTQLFILKCFINHAQLLSALSYIRVSFPSAIKSFLNGLSYISMLFITDLPIACFSFRHSEYIKATIGSTIAPTLCLLVIVQKKKIRVWKTCTSAMMFVPIITVATQMPLLACQSVETEEEYLFVDMQEKCWEGRHLLLVKAVLIPSVVLNVILPIALVIAIAVITPKKFDELFPLWRSGVNRRCWDLLVYTSKGVLICLLIVSISSNQLSQVAYGLTVLIIVSTTEAGLSNYAYIHWKWFALTEFSLVIVAMSMGLCAYFIYHSPSEGTTDWLISSVLLVLNVGYFAACVILWRFAPNLSNEEAKVISPCEIIVPPNSIIIPCVNEDPYIL